MGALQALQGELAVQAQSEEQGDHHGDGGDQQHLAPAGVPTGLRRCRGVHASG